MVIAHEQMPTIPGAISPLTEAIAKTREFRIRALALPIAAASLVAGVSTHPPFADAASCDSLQAQSPVEPGLSVARVVDPSTNQIYHRFRMTNQPPLFNTEQIDPKFYYRITRGIKNGPSDLIAPERPKTFTSSNRFLEALELNQLTPDQVRRLQVAQAMGGYAVRSVVTRVLPSGARVPINFISYFSGTNNVPNIVYTIYGAVDDPNLSSATKKELRDRGFQYLKSGVWAKRSDQIVPTEYRSRILNPITAPAASQPLKPCRNEIVELFLPQAEVPRGIRVPSAVRMPSGRLVFP